MTNAQARQAYRGDAFLNGAHVGGVFRVETGFEVREQLGTHVGPVLFNGRVFKKSDLTVTRQYTLGCRTCRDIEIKA